MPPDHDLNDGAEHPPTDGAVDGGSRSVGFLEIPELEVAALLSAAVDAFTGLDDDAVLSVYSTRVLAAELTARSRGVGIEVVHVVPQPQGTTFVLRRSSG